MSKMITTRRRFLGGTGAVAASAIAAPYILKYRGALAQDKPAELIVRAWGGVWVESLDAGVSQPFSEATGVPVRHDLTEDNEIRPKIWAAVDQGRVPPIHINWDTTTNATKSALRGVTEDLGGLAEPRGPAAARQSGPGGLAAGQHLLLRLRAGLSRRGFSGRPARQLACHDRPEVQGPGRDLRRRHRLPSGRPDRGRRHAGGHPRQHGAGLGVLREAEGERAAARRGPGLHQLVPERRDRRRLHDHLERARREAERHPGVVDGAQGGRQARHRRLVDPQGPARERAALGEGVRELRAVGGRPAGLVQRPRPAAGAPRASSRRRTSWAIPPIRRPRRT